MSSPSSASSVLSATSSTSDCSTSDVEQSEVDEVADSTDDAELGELMNHGPPPAVPRLDQLHEHTSAFVTTTERLPTGACTTRVPHRDAAHTTCSTNRPDGAADL